MRLSDQIKFFHELSIIQVKQPNKTGGGNTPSFHPRLAIPVPYILWFSVCFIKAADKMMLWKAVLGRQKYLISAPAPLFFLVLSPPLLIKLYFIILLDQFCIVLSNLYCNLLSWWEIKILNYKFFKTAILKLKFIWIT